MKPQQVWRWAFLPWILVGFVNGCATAPSVLPNAGIRYPIVPPALPPAPAAPTQLPAPPARQVEPPGKFKKEDAKNEEVLPAPPNWQPEGILDLSEVHPSVEEVLPAPGNWQPEGILDLSEVLQSVEQHFPLLLAAEQERPIAAGQRLAAEGAFDLNLRSRGATQDGTFPSNLFDTVAEQPTPFHGLSFFGGYRFGFGNYPVYYGDRLTADGGEFRTGVVLPLLKDGSIDRRRASLRQAQIGEDLADPVVRRARIDYFRAAARAYWNWVAAGEQYVVAESLLRIARDRQAGLEEQYKQGQIAEFVVIDNRRLIAEREGVLIAADRRFQQTSFDLSLFLRDPQRNPVVPPASRLPHGFVQQEPPLPSLERLSEDIESAYGMRPELTRFRLLKEQVAVDLRLAENQGYPALNAAVFGSQDVGMGKEATGIFALNRSVLEASLMMEVPLQRREARGRTQAARAKLTQLLAQERFARDQIGAEVQDAVSNMDRTHQRLQPAREEQKIAQRVAELELERFRKGQGTLLEVNLRELAAAGAQAKVIDALADYFRAQADYRAALGLDANSDALWTAAPGQQPNPVAP